jgi:phage recombination protein Bet
VELTMNVVAVRNPATPSLSWWQDQKMLALARRTTGKDCTNDEFDEFVAVCRDLNLSPLRKQIYLFIFSKDEPTRRNMSLVVGIDGGRSIAARTGNYRPDDREPEWVFKDELKNPLTNPNGIEKCTVGLYHRPTRNDPFERIVHTVYWEEFAPIVAKGDPDAYEWVPTGRYHPEGHKRAGQSIDRKRLRPGASANIVLRLDPDKAQWIKSGRNQIAKCAEMGVIRKGWPEDLSRVVVEEETHRSQVLEGVDYTDLTPSEMAAKGETDARLERLGGPALFATFDDSGTLERVAIGQFADRMMAATAKLAPVAVAALVERNREPLREFWAHNATDALELKKILEQRSGAVAVRAAGDEGTRAKAAPPQHGDSDKGGAAPPSSTVENGLTGEAPEKLRNALIRDIGTLDTSGDLLVWSRDARAQIARLPRPMATQVEAKFKERQAQVTGVQRP